MKTIRLRLVPIHHPLRLWPCLSTLFWLALALPAAATSLQLNFTVPSSFNESNRQAVLEWNGELAKSYLVQSATNLSPETVWKTEEPVRATVAGPIRWTAPESLRTEKYYQLILPKPEVFAVEPAFVYSGDPSALLYLVGQCLPTNGSVLINGQLFGVGAYDPNGGWVALSLNGLPPGTPVIGSILVLDNASNVVATLPLQNPVIYGTEATAEQIQGIPGQPPASPDALAIWASKRGYDYYQAQSMLNSVGAYNNPYFVQNENQGEMPETRGSKPNKDYATDPYVETSQRLSSTHGKASILPGTAELEYESTDLSVAGRGLSFEWTCTYRSRTGPATAMGAGWDFNFNVSLSPQPNGTMLLRSGNGRGDTFYPDGTNGWTRDEYFVEIRDLNLDGMPDVLFADTGKWLFKPSGLPESGKLWKILDRSGNAITLHYDGSGRLVFIVDTLDRTNTVAYNPVGLIESVTDCFGRSVHYEYDTQGDMVACISPPVIGTPNGNDFPGGKTNRFTYTSGNADNRLNHNLTSVIDGKGLTCLRVLYQPTNNPASPDFDALSAVLRGTDRQDLWRSLVTPSPSNSFATVQTIVNDFMGNVTEYLFDSRQRCVSAREFTGRANPRLPTTATDNRPKTKLRTSDPEYFETRWEYNADSLCIREIHPDGSSTEISHTRAQDHNSSRSNKTASRRHDGDVRVLRERASSTVDTDGDGAPDTSELAWYYDYDPRYGSPAACRGKKLYVGNLPFSFSESADRGWDGTIKGKTVDSAKLILDKETGRSKGFGFVIWSTDPRGNVSTSIYDTNGNCTKSIKQGHYAVSNFHIEIDGRYNSYGQLTAITNSPDANGNRRVDTIDYYTNGTQIGLVEVMVAVGITGGLSLSTEFAYDPHGNVTNIVDPRGNSTSFSWNNLDQCIQMDTPAYGGGSGQPPQRITSRNFYDANNNLVRRDVDNRDETGALSTTNPQWSTLFGYDVLDRLIGVVQEISEGGNVPPSYATNRYFYDANDNLREVRSPLAMSGADTHSTVSYEYDERDRLFREIAAPGSPEQTTTQCDYDSSGNAVRLSEGLEGTPAVTTVEYDALKYVGGGGKAQGIMGSKAKAWMVNNYEVHPVFGLKKWEWSPKLEGGKEGLASGILRWVETVWNKQCVEKDTTVRLADQDYKIRKIMGAPKIGEATARVSRTTDPMGNVTTYHYDRNSNLKVVRHFAETNDAPDSTGNILFSETRYTYDSFDRCVQQVDSFFDIGTGLPLGDGQATITMAYAPNGTCTSMTDDNGHTTRYTYDAVERLASITGPKTNVIQFAYDACGNVISMLSSERSELGQAPVQQFATAYTYDALNRVLSSSDNAGNTNRYLYDSRYNLISQLDPRENECYALYDGLNRCVAITNYVGKERGITINTSHVEYDVNSRCVAETDSNGNITQYTYDPLGRCIVVTAADGTSSSLVWSPRSNILRQQDPNGTVITNSYDLLDRCVSRVISPGSGVALTTLFELHAYDGASRCVAASNDVSLVTFGFDSLGNCVRSTQDSLASSYTYDAVGNCLSSTYPGGRVVTWTYDALDQVASVSSGAGGLPPALLAQYAYEGSSRLGSIIRPNGINTRVQWNGLVNPPNTAGDYGWQQVSRMTHSMTVGNAIVDQRTIRRDRSQNIDFRVHSSGNDNPTESITFHYDSLNRLTNYARVSGSPVVRQYVLDGNGNRQTVFENGSPQSYFMDPTFPIPADFQVNQYTSTPYETQQHDENGNLVVRSSPVGPTVYRFDYADRLVQVESLSPGGFITNAMYAYDALGRRIRKVDTTGNVTTFVLSPGSDVIEEGVNGALTRSYVRPEVDDEVLVAFNQAGQPLYYHYDDMGNTVALTDAAGAVAERYHYDEFGRVTFLTSEGFPTSATSSAVGNVFCWAGMCYDSETRLHNDLGGGYFDPLIGRKIAKESHGKFRLPLLNYASASSMKKGTVKFFNETKGFGMISSGGPAGTRAQDHNSSRSNKTASTRAQDHNSSRSNRTSSSMAQDHNSSRSNKTSSTKAQDHNSSRSNKTSSIAAPGGGGGGGGITVKLIVPVAMDKGLR